MADPSERFVLRPAPPRVRRECERARDDLRALMNFVEAMPDVGLDWWPLFVRGLADTYHASASIIWHEFGTTQKGELIFPVYSEDEYIEKYKTYSHLNPWLQFLWSRDAGFFIDGEEANPLTRTDSTDKDKLNFKVFYENWMLPQNSIRGLGAVLLKDKPALPDWAVGVGILRPDGERGVGLYTPQEKQEFEALIPFMLKHIDRCPPVVAHISQYNRSKSRYSKAATRRGLVPPPGYNSDELIDMLLAARGVAEHDRPAIADAIVQLVETVPGNPAALEATLAALKEATANADTAPSWRATVRRPRGANAQNALTDGGDVRQPPDKAPECYPPPPKDPNVKRPKVDTFIARVYAPWIVKDVLTFGREGLKRIDPECEAAVARWFNNHPGKSLFGMTARSKTVEPPTADEIREARRVLRWLERHPEHRDSQKFDATKR